eukprot:GHRR01025436.1.p1 GENE.GHRR01025436.1~~GHRR01025436.1.p1  ORF type:complete len:470 (+),score=104.98 GHRR01025436.1:442-1851(+)
MSRSMGQALLILLVTMLCATEQAVAQRFIAGPYGVARCPGPLTEIAAKTATLRPQNICATLRFDIPTPAHCAALDVLGKAVTLVQGDCLADKQVAAKSVSMDGRPIPAPLPDRRPVPAAAFADTAAVLREEGPTMYWHITSVINLEGWAPCHAKRPGTPFLVPEGWNLVDILTSDAYPGITAPTVAVLKSADGKHLAVHFRGTRTGYEYRVELPYIQVQDDNYPGMVNLGFLTFANTLWPQLEPVLIREVVNGNITEVTFAGHSLGAATSMLSAYRAQTLLDKLLPAVSKPKLVLGTLTFAQPNVGNPEFAAAVNKNINIRTIMFEHDVIPQLPCEPYMMACPPPNSVPSWAPGVKQWPYISGGGQITFTAGTMPQQPQAWTRLDEINVCRLFQWYTASHVCSYPCWFSQFAKEPLGRCKMWGPKTLNPWTSDASYCFDYPNHDWQYPSQIADNATVRVGTPTVIQTGG